MLSISGISKRFGNVVAVDNLSLEVDAGEFLGLLGPSGCGKTTLLRMIAGFLTPEKGRIRCRGKDITDLPPYRRTFGVVFQNYALFPHMTIAENVAYGLKIRGLSAADRASKAKQALEKVSLAHAAERFPAQLSGGQQQRAALARALVIEPDVLLLDEPLSALDKNLREEMQYELRRLQRSIGVTSIIVTHDQEEAMTLSDRIAVMKDGLLQQVGPPQAIYDAPVNEFVATFLGSTNLIPGTVANDVGEKRRVMVDGRDVDLRTGMPAGSNVRIAVRPEHLRVSSDSGLIKGTVSDVLFQGHRSVIFFQSTSGVSMQSYAPPGSLSIARGAPAFVSWKTEHSQII